MRSFATPGHQADSTRAQALQDTCFFSACLHVPERNWVCKKIVTLLVEEAEQCTCRTAAVAVQTLEQKNWPGHAWAFCDIRDLSRRLWRLFQYLDTARRGPGFSKGLDSFKAGPIWLHQGDGKLSVFDLKIFYLALLQAGCAELGTCCGSLPCGQECPHVRPDKSDVVKILEKARGNRKTEFPILVHIPL